MRSARWQEQLEADARAVLPEPVWRYVTAGAREEVTLGEASAAWSAVRLWPHVLRDVSHPDPSTTLLGEPSPFPLGIAPTSMQRLAHPDGEVAMAAAAAATDTVLVVSSNAGCSFDDIGATGARWWLQAYLTAERDLLTSTVAAAAAAGARAVVLTVDTPQPGTKYDLDATDLGDLRGVYGSNHPHAVRGETPGAEHARDLSADDISWLHDVTGLPVVVKGVLRGDDARRCVDAGAAAVWVSNHGGRQLDRAVSTCTALPTVAAAVGADAEVYVDGGIRSGLDVVTALALGARAVFVGRPPWLALAAGGTARVAQTLELLRTETTEALRLSGCPTLADTASLVAR